MQRGGGRTDSSGNYYPPHDPRVTPPGTGVPNPAPPPPAPDPGATGDTGGGDSWDFGEFAYPTYSGPMSPSFSFPELPTFVPPEFQVPSFEQAMQEPGYQFRLNAGEDALQRAAAAKGVLRTGGTLKDLIQYGQNFGAAEYQNVFNRALQGYNTRYQGAKDAFAPLMSGWQAKASAEQARGLAQFQRNWDIYQSQADAARYADERLIQLAGME